MTSGRVALAVLLRAAQWELDKAAFELGAGRYTKDERHRLADQLVELASVLRHDEVAPLNLAERNEAL
ncbi:hypothetical protein [Saccharopolyspora hattusasensis]|uniref:hypothetical protein n=1 Tax=Saccharopolyspora hattusasensis TaxID=1128679 RepID=UPI003D99E07C